MSSLIHPSVRPSVPLAESLDARGPRPARPAERPTAAKSSDDAARVGTVGSNVAKKLSALLESIYSKTE